MSKCIINLSKIELEPRQQSVFYATHKFIVYKDHLSLHLANCEGKILNSLRCPPDHRLFECIDLDDAVLFIFAGKQSLVLDKSGNEPIERAMAVEKIGRSVTPLLPSNDPFGVILGTRIAGNIQFINYDFMGGHRLMQTASWKMEKISHLCVRYDTVYGLLDNVFLVSCSAMTGETFWTRFETGQIAPKLIPYEEGLFYACQGVLKRLEDGKSSITRIPLARVYSLEYKAGDDLYLTSNEGKHLCCYNLKDNELSWEITGQLPIQETLVVQGKRRGRLYDIMAIRTKDHFSLVDLSRGTTIYHALSVGIHRIRQTEDHILIHKFHGPTDLLAGIAGE